MENLNAEQISRAFNACIAGECIRGRCPLYNCEEPVQECISRLAKNALALINSQEQRIKELAEENERLMREKTALECVVSTARNQAKADTVRKMQERLKAEMRNTAKYSFGSREYSVIGEAFIDQIAKEMLEGENEN